MKEIKFEEYQRMSLVSIFTGIALIILSLFPLKGNGPILLSLLFSDDIFLLILLWAPLFPFLILFIDRVLESRLAFIVPILSIITSVIILYCLKIKIGANFIGLYFYTLLPCLIICIYFDFGFKFKAKSYYKDRWMIQFLFSFLLIASTFIFI